MKTTGHIKQIILESDGTFRFTNIRSDSGNEGYSFNKGTDTWFFKGDSLILSFTDGYTVYELVLSDDMNFIEKGAYISRHDIYSGGPLFGERVVSLDDIISEETKDYHPYSDEIIWH